MFGVGLKSNHYNDILIDRPILDFFEIHPENYFGGGRNLEILQEISEQYALSIHSVGISLGRNDDLDMDHLAALKKLIDRFNPIFISDHISWSASGNAHLNDLLPVPYNKQNLQNICANVIKVQDYLSREILVENPSAYMAFTDSNMTEPEFITKVAQGSNCSILLDINNIFVQCYNNYGSIVNSRADNKNITPKNADFLDIVLADCRLYIDEIIAFGKVKEIHLAGYTEETDGEFPLYIDTHGEKTKPHIWDLYEYAIARLVKKPATLIEWDTDIPEFNILLSEAENARKIQNRYIK